ncbi:MAG TPA: transglutaminase-like domain-containing protein [Polyangiaceae bacterium]|nr:transglutaminase-like domain-containing protein [Polyangiaceae bacterium]
MNKLHAAIAIFALSLVAVPAHAYDPVLHEFIPPDDGEDLAMSVTTADGDLPAAIDTPSGVVRAPDTHRAPVRGENAYREGLAAQVPSVFRPDRDTRRPNMVRYDDPFSPSVAPYKRLRAFDTVGLDYGLRVRDTALVRVPVGGEARVGEEEFYADMAVDFESAATVLIPSVGPGARILRLHATPAAPLEVWRDGADNWYAKTTSASRGRVRLVMQVAIARAAFGGDFTMPSWENLRPVPPLPPMAARAFTKVEAALGLSRAISPTETVRRLVSYFRGFVPSEDPPTGHRDIYLDLALSQKGVCRHRAFAFLVTALGLGISARVVTNEAHAWVEVEADGVFRRIDLGGAAGAIDEGTADGRPAHRPPPDVFGWPQSDSGSGSQAAERGRRASSSGQPGQPGSMSPGDAAGRSSSSSGSTRTDPRSSSSDPRSREASAAERSLPDQIPERKGDDRPRPRVNVAGADSVARHGGGVHVAGRVDVDGSGCGDLRIDVVLRRLDTGAKTPVGALTTDANGNFDGNIVLPMSLSVGEYGITVATPGDARCGPGSSITR